nr:hypothetical protein [uncultured Acetatifactor sp.]
MKNADEFGKLESFGMNLLSQMGIAGLEEQKTLQAAVLGIQKNWKEQKLPKQEAAHFYRYSIRESGVLYGEDGIRIKQNLTGKKPMYLVSLSSPRTEFSKAIMAYTDSAYYHVSVSLQAGLGNLYSFMSPAAAGGAWEPGGGFCSDSIKRYRAEGCSILVSCVLLSEKDYRVLLDTLSELMEHQEETQYDYQGLVRYIIGKREEDNPFCMFCSQFVASLLVKTGIGGIGKEPCFTSPQDIAALGAESGVYRLYEGEARLYSGERIRRIVRELMRCGTTR